MKNLLVSAVIAVKNGEQFLASAIESILKQEYPANEIIFIDSNSTDSSADIAKSYKEIRYIRQIKQGLPDAWNVGIEAARGDLIAFLSHDDMWTPDKLHVQMNYMTEHPKIQYTIARVKFFMESGFPIPTGFRKELLEGDHIGRIPETLVVRKSLFDVIGNFNPQITSAEDLEWFARANDYKVPMAIMPELLLFKRIHDKNLTSNISQIHQNILSALRLSVERKRDSNEHP